jgi:RAB protein geranylgeranyltransferase component A
MPTYTFRDKNTGETYDKFMSMSAREEFLLENPNIETVIGAVATIRDTPKLDGGFREVLQKIHERTGGSNLKDRIR